MTGNELRNAYLEFFRSKDHLVLPSYSLIPENDPSLLLIGAGMAPFKPFFTGKMKPLHPRIVTSQKCIRTGDIENVGRTARHHTFFEMLGNFSFGDYFKREAIAWAWEFLTDKRYLNLPADKLWVTIYTDDDEAHGIWLNDIKVPAERIIRMEDNFWEIGTGPCGPCSEIYVDLGEHRGCGSADCKVGCDCDRYLEIWNLVFTQFDRDEAGEYTPLAKKNIDTGAGLERIASVLQNKPSNFETDLLYPLIEYAAKAASVEYGKSDKTDVSLKVVADHGRSMVVMIGDGVLPSNEGRGYVLRRILRRAVRHGRLMGMEKPFLVPLVDVVIGILGAAYPDLAVKRDYIKTIIGLEEERFRLTLSQGMELLGTLIADLQEAGKDVLPGEDAFKLYDTFGFPWELTREILAENGISLEQEGFERAMNEQRERARAARSDNNDNGAMPDFSAMAVEAIRVDESATEAKVVLLACGGKQVDKVHDGEEAVVVLDVTPFHAEGGGQVGDTGSINSAMGMVNVESTHKLPNGIIYQQGPVTAGVIAVGDAVRLQVNSAHHRAVARNHTATHLLHAALKTVLGDHVNQAGSLVTAERLRFDFSHFSAVTAEQLAAVEKLVNEVVWANRAVGIEITTQDKAREMGAMALFGEKYGNEVRVVSVDDFSMELCGGTHVATTAEIGLFRIVSEAGIGAGLRRIEALTGQGAFEYFARRENVLLETAATLKARPDEIVGKAASLLSNLKDAEREVERLHERMAMDAVAEFIVAKRTIHDVSVVAGRVENVDMEGLRKIADRVRDRLVTGVVVLGAINGDKVNFVAMVTQDIVARGVHAGNVVKAAAKATGGGGGGRADMAQAGGKDVNKIADALEKAVLEIKTQLEKN